MGTDNTTYPALGLPAAELSAFAICSDFFILSLKNGELIHFIPDDVLSFYAWLVAHDIRDVHKSKTLNTFSKKVTI